MKTFNKFLISILILIFAGCNDDVINISDPANTSFEQAIEDKEDLQLLVNGVYNGLYSTNFIYNNWTNWPMVIEARSDDAFITPNGTGFQNMGSLTQFTNISSDVLPTNLWLGHYTTIRRANEVLEIIPILEDETFTDELKEQFRGEALFLRGYSYFVLVKNFGERIPLITQNAGTINQMRIRPAEAGEVWAQIERDLQEAELLLPVKESYSANDAGRATKGAAAGILGKSYLYQLRYQEALNEFEKIINQQVGTYELTPFFRDNSTEANENNIESLFEVQNAPQGSQSGLWFALPQSSGIGRWYNIAPSQEIIDVFVENPGDPRYHMTFYAPGGAYYINNNDTLRYESVNTMTYRKYDNERSTRPLTRTGINYRILRYADVLLMAAECAIALNDETKAKNYISQVRQRANNVVNDQPQLYYSTSYTGELPEGFPIETDIDTWMQEKGWTLREVLYNERRMELSFEQVRYYDLIRWHKAGWLDIKNFITAQGFVVGQNEIFPIPERELASNPAMIPNAAN